MSYLYRMLTIIAAVNKNIELWCWVWIGVNPLREVLLFAFSMYTVHIYMYV